MNFEVNNNNSSTHNSIPVVIAAPTGLAAYNVGGVTLHRLLMLPVEHRRTARYEKLSAENAKIIRKTLNEVKLLIIDEISMVSSLMLTYIHLRLNEIMENTKQLFGGINAIVFGDLMQLPPVKGNPPFSDLTNDEINLKLESVGSVNLWKEFKYDELTINVRQNDDTVYSNLLGRVRVGQMTVEDKEVLESRLFETSMNVDRTAEFYQELVNSGEKPVCLMSTLKACRWLNEKMQVNLHSPVVNILSIDEITYNINSKKIEDAAMKKLNVLSNDISRTAGLETNLKLNIGARIMSRRNIDINLGLVNGSMGKITNFMYEGNIVKYISIKFDNGIEENLSRSSTNFQLMLRNFCAAASVCGDLIIRHNNTQSTGD